MVGAFGPGEDPDTEFVAGLAERDQPRFHAEVGGPRDDPGPRRRARRVGLANAASELEFFLNTDTYRGANDKGFADLEPAGWYSEDYHLQSAKAETSARPGNHGLSMVSDRVVVGVAGDRRCVLGRASPGVAVAKDFNEARNAGHQLLSAALGSTV